MRFNKSFGEKVDGLIEHESDPQILYSLYSLYSLTVYTVYTLSLRRDCPNPNILLESV